MKRKKRAPALPSWLADAYKAANSKLFEHDDCPICKATREHGGTSEKLTLPDGVEIEIMELQRS